ncbi:MAG: BamA/TamA family outer membrane protein [Bacteroidetes bacterium]|nr:BamA/TamA family outer membrane protein [Bacteroidota bacterium]
MHQPVFRFSLILFAALSVISCRQAKYVADEKYLHKKNTILFETTDENGDTVTEKEYDNIYTGEMYDLIKPTPNKGFKLFVYNRIDTTRYHEQLERKHTKCQTKNDKRKAKEDKINAERIADAKKHGKEYYTHRTKRMKEPKNGWRDWVIVHMGEAPVLFDTSLVRKSTEQLDIYLEKRGYFDASVRDTIYYNDKKQKAKVAYIVTAGEGYHIGTFALDPSTDANVVAKYSQFLKAEKSVIEVGQLIDEDRLNLERENFTKYCRDEGAFFGFNKSYVTFEVDTLGKDHYANVIMHVAPRGIPHPAYPDSIVYVPYGAYRVKSVTFMLHNPDTNSFKFGYSNFKKRCDQYNLPYMTDGKYTLLDTLVNIDTIFYKHKDPLIVNKGVFIYNDVPFLEPDLIDKQNFLYIPHWAKEYYLERTYRTMLQLDVFSTITPIVEIDPNDPFGMNVNVTYDLVPAKRQTFVLEPRVTNSNSILGVMGSISYTNKNLARGAQKLKISFTGGFESQPLIVSEEGVETQVRKLNTFEWGPHIQFTFPKLVPMPKKVWQTFSKRLYPSTQFDLIVNFQRRVEFARGLAYFSYEWSFKQDKTQEWKVQFVNFNFVRLDKTDAFKLKLLQLDDPFLINSYADHFSLFNGLVYKFTNQVPNQSNDKVHNFQVSVLQSGGIMNATGIGTVDTTSGLKQILGVPFTQFVRIDNQYLFLWKITKKHKIATRLLAGMGWAYGNSPSLPYEQSFVAGGSNDIRAFTARSMAPGSIRVLEDSTATSTQIGDMRLELNAEYRFYINDLLEGAFFVDMGNIWKVKDDATTTKDDLGVFHFNSFYKQVAIGTGFGIRADFDFLIVRLDLAFAVHNPYLPEGEKWFATPHPVYISNWDTDGSGTINDKEWDSYVKPFPLRFNVGIGYPF